MALAHNIADDHALLNIEKTFHELKQRMSSTTF